MIFHPLILWTDALIYLLVTSALVFMLWARKYEHLHLAWQHVLKQRTAFFALMILLVYITIGLLDSIHLEIMQHSIKTIKSLLDIATGSLGSNDEKTYSAPFASHLYVKEIITRADGSQIRDYPVLRFPKMHILGTDKVGQDVFYQALKSVRTGLIIGTLTTLIMLPFAVIFGMMAGYFRGWIDDVIQYVYTTLSSIPDVLLIAAAILSLQLFFLNHPVLFPTLLQRADMRLIILCAILGITSWTYLCRLLRGETLKLREQDYVQAAIALGSNRSVILFKHILPNLMHLIVIAVVMDFSV